MASKGLNPKQTRFVAEYLKDLNATQAAIRSGYSAKTAEQIGSRLLRNVGVAVAVAKGQSRVAERLELSAEIVLRNLEKARAEAMAAGQFSAAIRAAELQGKHIGMFEDKLNVRLRNDPNALADDELAAIVAGAGGGRASEEAENPPLRH